MTSEQERDFAQIERDTKAAEIAKVQRKIYREELGVAEIAWMNTYDRLTNAIKYCDKVIARVESDG